MSEKGITKAELKARVIKGMSKAELKEHIQKLEDDMVTLKVSRDQLAVALSVIRHHTYRAGEKDRNIGREHIRAVVDATDYSDILQAALNQAEQNGRIGERQRARTILKEKFDNVMGML